MTHVHPTYDVDKRIIVDGNTRVMNITESNRPVLIQYDNNSEVVTFEVDRYVEGHDLSLSNKAEVHYNNIDVTGRRTSKGLYEATDLRVSPDDKTKVLVSWFISNQATEYEGTLNFVLALSCLEDDVFNVYRWNSRIGTFLVSAGINNTEYLEKANADVLEMWKQELFGIGDTEEARMLALSERLRDELEVKAAQVTESMPDEYLDYSEFEKSKADVSDINRLFDSDWVVGNRENLYPHGDSKFTYDGESLYTGVSAGGNFYLEEGRYDLIITDTNAVGVYVMLGDTDTRVLEIKDHHIGVHGLNILSEYANKPLTLRYYASAATANEAGEYYIKRPYIFKSSDEGVLSNDFFIKSPAKLFESDLVRNQKGENLYTGGDIEFYYDGQQVYKGKNGFSFTLEEGDYTLSVMDSNAIFFIIYVGEASSSATRILATKEIPNGYKFTVTSEYANQPLLFFISASLETAMPAGDCYAKSIYIFKDDGVPFLPDYLVNNVERKLVGSAYKAENGSLSISSETLSAGEMLSIDAICDVKNNKSLVFTARFDSFSGLRLGHGKNSYGGSYIELYNQNVGIYQYTTASTNTGQHPHGLTFSDFITVVINVGVNKANVTIFTAGGSFTVNDVQWSGCNGNIFAEAIDTTFTDCEMKWTTSDVKERVWVFGDSYLGFNNSRWAGQMHNLGYTNWLACGFPGGRSASELASFKTLLTLGTPDTVIWCMGMNDGDNGAVNSSWQYNVTEVMSLCKEKHITLILATIPTCPIVDNTYKNAWIKASGYRYIDFDKAVGVNGTSWYNGMMAGDEIHPTELGAKALAARVCIDAPEIMQ